MNYFFSAGVRVRRFARFKRIGDKQGWGSPEWKEGLELDRQFFFDRDLTRAAARISELVEDGCEFVSYKKHPAPGGKVTYLLISWPTNAELERDRVKRTSEGRPKQAPPPRELTPYRRPQPYHAVESDDWYTRQTGKPRPSTTSTTTTQTIDLPLFDGIKQ